MSTNEKAIVEQTGGQPKVSIITVCYNSAKTIRDTIESVINQTYPNIEYIIVDGGSTDGTIDIIKSYEHYISKWVSEPDEGIYDAMNKGIKFATGEIVGIINSDDWYSQNAICEIVDKFLIDNEVKIVHGNIVICDSQGRELYKIYGERDVQQESYCRMTILHPTMFVRKSIYDQQGMYDSRYSIAADYDFLLKNQYQHGVEYLDSTLAFMRLGGVSNSSYFRMGIEYFLIRKKYKVNILTNIAITSRAIVGPFIRRFLENIGLGKMIRCYRVIKYKNRLEFEERENG